MWKELGKKKYRDVMRWERVEDNDGFENEWNRFVNERWVREKRKWKGIS